MSGSNHQAMRLAVLALLLAFAGPLVYFFTLDIPLFRSSGLPVWGLHAAGLTCAVMAVLRDKRYRVRIVASCTLLFTLLFGFGFFALAAVPEATTLSSLESAPDFTLQDHNSKSVSLRDSYGSGQVLLVFYRGHW